MRKELIKAVQQTIMDENEAANKKFAPFNSTHEGYAVILEEAQETEEELRSMAGDLNELWERTKRNADPDALAEVADALIQHATNMAAEATQTAAMGIKYIQFLQTLKQAAADVAAPAAMSAAAPATPAATAAQQGINVDVNAANTDTDKIVEQITRNIKNASGAAMFRNA